MAGRHRGEMAPYAFLVSVPETPWVFQFPHHLAQSSLSPC